MKKVKLIFLFVIIIGIGVFIQIEVESYISEQEEKYDILDNRNRVSYKPAILYYIKRSSLNKRSMNLPYYEKGLDRHSSTGFYDEYILECYYSDIEKEEFIKQWNLSNG